MESTTAGTLVTTGLKRSVNGPCWNLNCGSSQHVREHAERMSLYSSLFLRQVRRDCLSFHLRRTCLSLQLVVCFCSVVHRTVYTSARSCLSARTIHNLVCIGSRFHGCITMSSMFAPAHFSCSHSTPLTHSSSSSIPSSRTISQVTLPIKKTLRCSSSCGVWPFGQKHLFQRLWTQRDRQLRLLRDYWNLPPGAIQRHDALVLAWRAAQWRDHRQSAIFTTVHSGATRTSGP